MQKHSTMRKKNALRKNSRKTEKKLSLADKQEIVRILNPVTVEMALEEFLKLKQTMTCPQAKRTSSRTTLGNNVVDAFTLIERLHTKGHQGISFYDFWNNRKEYLTKPYVKNMLKFYESRKIAEIRKYKYIYNLYFSSISIFRPIVAIDLYCKVKAKRVLDFTMGWGGRLVGACALSLDAYYGIDINKHLEKPYKEMVKMLQSAATDSTDIHLVFEDALSVDYSKMDYDTVLTSPPYYDLEVYRRHSSDNAPYKTHVEWNEQFYKPLIRKTYAHLKNGGHYCLNVPQNIYDDGCVPVLGKCSAKIMLKKGQRNIGGDYKEYIYIWKKEN
jgi:hypothetical protein